jgi:hypothetical protein
MIVNHFDVFGAGNVFRPLEADASFIVDPNAELPLPVALKAFETIALQRSKVCQAGRCFKYSETPLSLSSKRLKPCDSLATGKTFGPFVAIAPNHV